MESGEVSIQPAEITKTPRLPTTWEFRARLFKLRHTAELSERPPVPENPTASDLARYGQVDWEHIDGKQRRDGKPLAVYLHDLARFMMTQEGYFGTTPDGQPVGTHTPSLHVGDGLATQHIQVRDDWSLGWDGKNRMLVLKLLGPDFVEKSGMNNWVKVKKI